MDVVSLKQLIDADESTRWRMQAEGVNVVPAGYYSAIPSIDEIHHSFEYTAGSPPYLDSKLFSAKRMNRVLKAIAKYAGEFRPPVECNGVDGERFYWKNPMFSYSDAMAYYCFLRHFRPQTIVEIGSGYSTLVALEAVRKNDRGRIVCVEPHPREFLKTLEGVELVEKPAQALESRELNELLEHDNDFLFIDSTHVVKTGSDCVHLYLRLIPRLRRPTMIHAHDIFLPHGMPKHWLMENQLYWNEQYLLHALLCDNSRARVLYGSAYHETFNKPALEAMMGGEYPPGGSSFWFAYRRESVVTKIIRRLRRYAGRE